jgi:hypothetical protein
MGSQPDTRRRRRHHLERHDPLPGRVHRPLTPVTKTADSLVEERTRNALNRFTSGVDRQLFSETIERGIEITLEISGQADVPDWIPHAVAHAVRDLSEGLVGFGRRSGVGLGTLEAVDVRAAGAWRTMLTPQTAAMKDPSLLVLAGLGPVPAPLSTANGSTS